jgi:glucuronosyltransferase
MGNDVNPAIYPDIQAGFLNHYMTFSERVQSLMFYLLCEIFLKNAYFFAGSYLQYKHLPQIKVNNALVIQDRLHLLITNTHPSFGHLRAIMPNTIQVGFMHVQPPKELEDEVRNGVNVKRILDASTNGVIVMCLGSKITAADMGFENVLKFISAFRQLPNYEVIWKFDELVNSNSTLSKNLPKNIHMTKWLPLADVLAHKNVKLMVSHAGLMSAYEAIDREVPMVVFPLAYDHDANARMLEHKKIATKLELNKFTSDDLQSAIVEMMKPIYKKNIALLRKRVYDEPMTGKQKVVWNIERLIRWKDNTKLLNDHVNSFTNYESMYLDIIIISIVTYCALKIITRKISSLVTKASS